MQVKESECGENSSSVIFVFFGTNFAQTSNNANVCKYLRRAHLLGVCPVSLSSSAFPASEQLPKSF